MIRLPGLADVHVHTRQPGQVHKEDWSTASAAALAGGFTAILAMPNTDPPVTDAASLELAFKGAHEGARCDFGQYVGATPWNPESVAALAPRAAGLKMYLNDTFGELRLDDMTSWTPHLEAWPADRPLVAHAEGRTMGALVLLAHTAGRPIHICHVSRREEIELIGRAKASGVQVTCEVAPHHLFLSAKDAPNIGEGRCEVRPPLGDLDDQAALWEHLEAIDVFATDHAPHLLSEKDGHDPPPGFAGLETALPLLLTAVHEGRLSIEQVTQRLDSNPRRIFGLPAQPDTYIEVDPEASWQISGAHQHSRAKWTPFEGRTVRGRVERVVLRGREAFANGEVLSPPGSGLDLRQEEETK
ncbi:MAG: amidohydrolase family protein [Acidimicrobiia bacterium]|nr:amidohydrolase family protein [Acidimicrobiia bacterium]MDH3470232.1 amidohydrolase family protein [Acidimicrobiia bacterium]